MKPWKWLMKSKEETKVVVIPDGVSVLAVKE